MSFPWQKLSCLLPAGPIDTDSITPLAGGDINSSFCCSAGGELYFVKFNPAPELLQTEARNLHLLREAPLRTPEVIFSDIVDKCGVLVLEYLALKDRGNEASLGRQLALLHRHTASRYGLDFDNFIGWTPQHNSHTEDWADFWVKNRLGPQLELAQKQGYAFSTAAVLSAVAELLTGHQPPASLLHGDFWSGNKGYLADGTPVIFDPACYYGDRETDIAFTRLFGGFSSEFYTAYQNAWPLPEGFEVRARVYNLYHLLNHLNMFGQGYFISCQREIDAVLSSV